MIGLPIYEPIDIPDYPAAICEGCECAVAEADRYSPPWSPDFQVDLCVACRENAQQESSDAIRRLIAQDPLVAVKGPAVSWVADETGVWWDDEFQSTHLICWPADWPWI